jgi:hypothetical protein
MITAVIHKYGREGKKLETDRSGLNIWFLLASVAQATATNVADFARPDLDRRVPGTNAAR